MIMQLNYHYYETDKISKNFKDEFIMDLNLKEILEPRAFGCKYLFDCIN